MTDDLAMRALSGTPAGPGAAGAGAGCDLALYCTGELARRPRPAGDLPADLTDGRCRSTGARRGRSRTAAHRAGCGGLLAAERDRLLA